MENTRRRGSAFYGLPAEPAPYDFAGLDDQGGQEGEQGNQPGLGSGKRGNEEEGGKPRNKEHSGEQQHTQPEGEE